MYKILNEDKIDDTQDVSDILDDIFFNFLNGENVNNLSNKYNLSFNKITKILSKYIKRNDIEDMKLNIFISDYTINVINDFDDKIPRKTIIKKFNITKSIYNKILKPFRNI